MPDDAAIYYDLYPDAIDLSLMHIKEKNANSKTGIYVPALVFYGKVIKQYGNRENINPDGHVDFVLFASNAVNGSIID